MNTITTVLQVQELVKVSFPRKQVKLSGDVLRDPEGHTVFSVHLLDKNGEMSAKPYTYIHVTESSIYVSKKVRFVGNDLLSDS